MEAAKRMVLVDERVLDSLQRKQDSSWRKPTDQVAKSKLNREMKNDLVDGNILEDVKVKKYNQDLSNFLHTKHKIPIESVPLESEKLITVDVQGIASQHSVNTSRQQHLANRTKLQKLSRLSAREVRWRYLACCQLELTELGKHQRSVHGRSDNGEGLLCSKSAGIVRRHQTFGSL
jgi:hypothetical protein